MAKIHCLASGIGLSANALTALAQERDGKPIAFSEFPTTGGLTFALDGAGYVNAPFTGAFSVAPTFTVDHNGSSFLLRSENLKQQFTIKVLPLPSFIGTDGSRPFGAAMITHADRVRLSPVNGCAYSCGFSDLHYSAYEIFGKDTLLEALHVAIRDPVLPARHALISGGTPKIKDQQRLDEIYEYILSQSPIPVDVMVAPRLQDAGFIKRLFDWGTYGFAINIELFGESRREIVPQKAALGLRPYSKAIEEAVALTGGNGRVRSLLVVGLEPRELTLRGVKWLAERGCNPVLSPFRPATGTSLEKHPIPSAQFLAELWVDAHEITEKHGVKIGPVCIPCQHNDLSFPEP